MVREKSVEDYWVRSQWLLLLRLDCRSYIVFFKASEIKEAIILERPLPSVEKMGW